MNKFSSPKLREIDLWDELWENEACNLVFTDYEKTTKIVFKKSSSYALEVRQFSHIWQASWDGL